MMFSTKFSGQEISQISDHGSPQMILEVNQNNGEGINNNNHADENENCDTLLHLPYNIFIMVLVDIWKHLIEFKNVKIFIFIYI